MISKISSAVINGLQAILTEVEVGFSRGLPGTTIVGLPDSAVKESKERIRFAIKNSGFDYPVSTKIVVNLSPADIRKEGSALDLPISVGILKNSYQLSDDPSHKYLFYGELNLNGDLRPVRGVLNLAMFARQNGFKGIVIPCQNSDEGSFVKGIAVYGFENLRQVISFIKNPEDFQPHQRRSNYHQNCTVLENFREIRGQHTAKRVMEISAAGFHNVLMIGPPGSGKSMIAKALPSILPDMTDEEILETSLIYSAAGLLDNRTSLITSRPFRTPHHTISDVGVSGGGKYPVPGEISLAHNGVLFLDELPHFKKSALEVLRQPLEDEKITISRSLTSFTYPSRFMLIAAMNPFQDSQVVDKHTYYSGSLKQKLNYYSRISKPLLDRIDLLIEVKKVKIEEIASGSCSEDSQTVKQRVVRARNIQLFRFKGSSRKIFANGQMKNPDIKKFCPLNKECQDILQTAVEKMGLSARSYFKMIKIARTIADLDLAENICKEHLSEALLYRSLNVFSH